MTIPTHDIIGISACILIWFVLIVIKQDKQIKELKAKLKMPTETKIVYRDYNLKTLCCEQRFPMDEVEHFGTDVLMERFKYTAKEQLSKEILNYAFIRQEKSVWDESLKVKAYIKIGKIDNVTGVI